MKNNVILEYTSLMDIILLLQPSLFHRTFEFRCWDLL